MNKILILIMFIAFILVSRVSIVQGSEKPEYGDHICWAAPTEDTKKNCQDCSGAGIYAWHKNLNVSKRTAIEFCQKHFKGICVLEYCEIVSK